MKLTAETKIKLFQIKDLAAWHQQLVQDKHDGDLLGTSHTWKDGKEHIKTAHGWRLASSKGTGSHVKQKANFLKKLDSWCTKENLDWARGKTTKECCEHFGHEKNPIAIMQDKYLKYFPGTSTATIHCSKGDFIDHMANHGSGKGLVPGSYKDIQKVLDDPSAVYKSKDGSCLMFTKQGQHGEYRLIIKKYATDKLVFEKTFEDSKRKIKDEFKRIE